MTELTKQMMVDYLQDNFKEDQIGLDLDEAKLDYVDEGWEEEFDDEYEAYAEQGRGEAEMQVATPIEEALLNKFSLDRDEYEEIIGETVCDTVKEVFEILHF